MHSMTSIMMTDFLKNIFLVLFYDVKDLCLFKF